jgi:hypothetical protein
MRINYSDEEDFSGQFGLWQANCDRSLRGKKGVAVLRELEAALVALPQKRLIDQAVAKHGDVCAVGALMADRLVKRGKSRHEALAELAESNEGDTAALAEADGVPHLVAWKLVAMNDLQFDTKIVPHEGSEPVEGYYYHRVGSSCVPYTPEERYAAMLAWVRERIAEATRRGQEA